MKLKKNFTSQFSCVSQGPSAQTLENFLQCKCWGSGVRAPVTGTAAGGHCLVPSHTQIHAASRDGEKWLEMSENHSSAQQKPLEFLPHSPKLSRAVLVPKESSPGVMGGQWAGGLSAGTAPVQPAAPGVWALGSPALRLRPCVISNGGAIVKPGVSWNCWKTSFVAPGRGMSCGQGPRLCRLLSYFPHDFGVLGLFVCTSVPPTLPIP